MKIPEGLKTHAEVTRGHVERIAVALESIAVSLKIEPIPSWLVAAAPELLAAAQECALWFGPFNTERFEEAAERFHRATGFMAPGKDVSAAMHPGDEWERERAPAWRAWCVAQIEAARVALQAAIAKATGGEA